MIRAVVILWCVVGGIGSVSAERVPTPQAFRLLADQDTIGGMFFAAGEFLPGSASTRIGFYVLCDFEKRRTEGGFSFGSFPSGVPVQAAVRGPDGRVTRFGPVLRGTPASGFHSPVFEGVEAVRRFVDVVFVSDTLASNGHNSVFNRLPEEVNRRVRERMSVCLATL